MRSILAKIFGLILSFNIILWVFALASDDFVTNEIDHKKNQLILASILYAQIALPTIRNPDISEFEKQVGVSELLSHRNITNQSQTRVYRFEAEGKLSQWFKYFDGASSNRLQPIKVTVLPSAKSVQTQTAPVTEQVMSRLFRTYKLFVSDSVLTEPLVERRARFSIQSEILASDLDT